MRVWVLGELLKNLALFLFSKIKAVVSFRNLGFN